MQGLKLHACSTERCIPNGMPVCKSNIISANQHIPTRECEIESANSTERCIPTECPFVNRTLYLQINISLQGNVKLNLQILPSDAFLRNARL